MNNINRKCGVILGSLMSFSQKLKGTNFVLVTLLTVAFSCKDPGESFPEEAKIAGNNHSSSRTLNISQYQAEYDAEFAQGYFWAKRETETSPSYASNYKNRIDRYRQQQARYPDRYAYYQAKITGLTDGWMQGYMEIPNSVYSNYLTWFRIRLGKPQAPLVALPADY